MSTAPGQLLIALLVPQKCLSLDNKLSGHTRIYLDDKGCGRYTTDEEYRAFCYVKQRHHFFAPFIEISMKI